MNHEQNAKNNLRLQWKKKRDAISPERQAEASAELVKILWPQIQNARHVLSYMSLPNELDTTPLNQKLIESGKLVLPKITEKGMELFQVENLEKDLKKGAFSVLEPDNQLCKAIPAFLVDVALIPAIAFDSANHRLGYGKGHFDRFLAEHGKQFQTIGIGFKEQFSDKFFPVEKHDISLSRIVLV